MIKPESTPLTSQLRTVLTLIYFCHFPLAAELLELSVIHILEPIIVPASGSAESAPFFIVQC